MSDLATITEQMKTRVGENSGLGASVKFDFKGDGIVYVDGKSVPNVVSNEDKPADCTIKIAKDDFIALGDGKLNPTTAFMMGKIKVEGNMGVAMKLQTIFK
ncbi:SCP2 sterol-binding domain-containing protein [Zavarzinia compransoris]|uniref:Sterol-binding protein n=1 Tax=Zavarzinia compransoris TaxID=1264899 RepID=A0A317DT74_9PROT|nr:SCP2 sterol-binding domain-containing protein [Zavarzinia compransoris]PWR17564.1 sterol-binding protein [Zavarzinia compransoris]TDP49222.1 putative sterol carrier protein [Zavarzinia compransoris]